VPAARTIAGTIKRSGGLTVLTEPTADALQAIFERQSIRSYGPRRIDWPTIRSLLAAAVQAPSAMHREPWRFVVIQDRARLARLSERARLLFADEAHRDLVDRGGHALDVFAKPGFDIFYGAGTLIVVGALESAPFAVADCWLAAENLMLAAHHAGLGTCVIGTAVAALNEADVKTEIGIPDLFTAVAPIIVGVAEGLPEPKRRREPIVLAWL
jgi:nitroreductase